ncbi:MAG: hypothetical protein DHS20C19_15850 [Acidimicrobiales bacterium]|nr:MAG: hypothetical protein DHS20C19_15850 [Acidimicrobiales bacterium]
MGVDVDESGRDEGAIGVDLTTARLVDPAHGDDRVAVDRHIGGARGSAGAVDDRSPTYHEIMHVLSVSQMVRAVRDWDHVGVRR